MIMSDNNVIPNKHQVLSQNDKPMVDVKLLWFLITLYWRWIVAIVVAFVLIAGAYLWFTPSTITVTGKMEIIDKSKNNSGMSAGLAMLNSLPLGLGSSLGGAAGSMAIDSEKERLMSNSLVTNVVNELKLYTEYRHCKWGRKILLYQNSPITVTIDPAHLRWLDDELPLYLHQIQLTITKSGSEYEVETILKENKDKQKLPLQSFGQLPATIKTDAGVLTLTENKLTEKQAKNFGDDYTLKVTIVPPIKAAENFVNRTTIDPPSKKVMDILNITLLDENILRGIDYVNCLVNAYNKRANNEKNVEALKTDEFVNSRLAKIDAELGSSDAAWESSKKNFQITEPEIDAQEVMEKKSLYESKMVEIGTELQLHDYLSEYVHNPENLYELIPVGMAGSMGNLSGDASSKESSSNASLIAQHNTLVSQRKELLRSMSEKSPQIQRLTESIKELHPTLLTSLKRDRQNLVMKRNAVEREYSKYMGRVNTAPKMERVLTEIGRQREIKQGVYLLMLQKREETAMELANTTDKGRLIDPPAVDPGSGKPQKKIILLVALLLGGFVPVGVLYLLQVFKTKINTFKELVAATTLPILAEMSSSKVDESIRILRTNLLLNLKEGQKIVLIASPYAGDGKTSIAKRLEESLNVIGKKTTLINGDLRKFGNKQHPADVFASQDFVSQIDKAKSSNDYVLIDSPAIRSYNDAYQLASFADATLYVAKANKTQKSDLESLNSNKKLPNPLIVFNV